MREGDLSRPLAGRTATNGSSGIVLETVNLISHCLDVLLESLAEVPLTLEVSGPSPVEAAGLLQVPL